MFDLALAIRLAQGVGGSRSWWQKIGRERGASQVGCSSRKMQPARSLSNQKTNNQKPRCVHPAPFMFHYQLFAASDHTVASFQLKLSENMLKLSENPVLAAKTTEIFQNYLDTSCRISETVALTMVEWPPLMQELMNRHQQPDGA